MKFCPKCHVDVAPGDPERREFQGNTYHKNCLKQIQNVVLPQTETQLELIFVN